MPKNIEDKDLGMNKIREGFTSLGGYEVTVGVHGKDATTYQEATGATPVTTAAVAFFNEFGVAGNPERSFLRSTMSENEEKYIKLDERLINLIIDGKLDALQATEILGQQAKKDVQQKIVDIKEPPNSEKTIAAKGSSNPLIDTGQMRQSIDYVVNKTD
jgi:hypothetical protein